jgi:hypothetical protein
MIFFWNFATDSAAQVTKFQMVGEYYVHNKSERKKSVVVHLETAFYAGGFP